MARHPAAFINEIAESGTKDDAVKYLQVTWDDYCESLAKIAELRQQLKDATSRSSQVHSPIENAGE